MSSYTGYFLFGLLTGIVGLIVVSCCYVSCNCSREEERKDAVNTTEPSDEEE